MKLTTKDTVGLLLVVGTVGALLVHIGPDGHAAKHPLALTDGGGSATTAIENNTVAFVNVNVLPMNGEGILANQVVVVEGGFVRRIGPIGEVSVPIGALQINGNGTQFVMPGLTDAHVHLGDDARDWLPLFVANGVTTVFNLRGDPGHLRLRDQIRSREVLGPMMYTSGPFTSAGETVTPDQAAREVQRQAARGYDFVKIHGVLSEEAYRRLVQVAQEEEIAVVGHAPRNLPLSEVLESGQAGLTHAEELIYTRFSTLDESDLDRAASEIAAAGTWITPTLSTFANNEAQWGTRTGLEARLGSEAALAVPRSLRERWAEPNFYTAKDSTERPQISDMLDFHRPMLRSLGRAGVPMLTGTDAGLPVMVPGSSLHDELDALVDAGLGRYGALQAATRNAGLFVRRFVHEDASFGTVTLDARADLLLLDQNPLLDLSGLRQPRGVMLRGEWFDRAALDAMLDKAGDSR
ncbi:MAG: amidohydrolase family protein [Gemmatimonadota bacterium]|nr:amidohydrolase family protein [Gemmatimonadota bacterium]